MQVQYDAVLELLKRHGAETVPHPGGTLLAHLQRVERRLRDHAADDVLRLAALGHAVYGMDGFDTALPDLDQRHVLGQAANVDAEGLVYLYAACDRSRTWPGLGETREIHDRWTGTSMRPSPVVLARFVDLSIANELDVIEHSAEARATFSRPLLDTFRSWRGLGSPVVEQDSEKVLTAAI